MLCGQRLELGPKVILYLLYSWLGSSTTLWDWFSESLISLSEPSFPMEVMGVSSPYFLPMVIWVLSCGYSQTVDGSCQASLALSLQEFWGFFQMVHEHAWVALLLGGFRKKSDYPPFDSRHQNENSEHHGRCCITFSDTDSGIIRHHFCHILSVSVSLKPWFKDST